MLAKDDHRRLGRELDLFHFQEEARGAVFWHPRGLVLLRGLEEHVRRAVARDGYEEVRTPLVIGRPIWDASGHWQAFAGGMVRAGDDEDEMALKPVSCPAHVQIVERRRPSWRDLPIRLSELGVVHRNEPRGVLNGLFRLRQFQQDDGHVFCSEDQVDAEVERFLRRVLALYASLGLDDVEVALSLRPPMRFGDDALWDRAEGTLARCAEAVGLACDLRPGEGAFYGPKIELVLRDASGRRWQCGTLQLDFVMPQRFDLGWVDARGEKRPFVMLHRAMLGSFERFCGILLEHHRGRLPPWLAPEAVRVLPVSAAHAGWAAEVAARLRAEGVRAELDARDGPLPGRVALARNALVPFAAVAGARESAARAIVLRDLSKDDRGRSLPVDEAAKLLAAACAPPDVDPA
jgi:threonyl-tRNA synthetase